MSPKAKYKLHATKVDRIAIVDRPAVPDAEIVVFKRQKDIEIDSQQQKFYDEIECEKSFMSIFVFKAVQAAVDSLQEEIWNAIYLDTKNTKKLVTEAFSDFKGVINDVALKLVKTNKASSNDVDSVQFTEEEIVGWFKNGLLETAISDGFLYFRGNLAYMVYGYDNLQEPEATVGKVIDTFQAYITRMSTEMVTNKRQDVLEKAGRIISASRLRKLKEAQKVINDIILETEERYTKNSSKEADAMELKEVLDKLTAVSASVEEITKSQKDTMEILNKKGLLQTEEEIDKAKAEQVEADKKAKEEKDALDKKAKEEQDVLDKKAKEDAEALDKAKKETEEVDKKAKETADARLTAFDEAITKLGVAQEAIMKRVGVTKTSLDTDVQKDKKKSGDVFSDSIRG